MGYDGKYGQVTTERKDIPADEPVIVFRAQDKRLLPLLRAYWELCANDEQEPAGEGHLRAITETHRRVALWQDTHPGQVKAPDTQPGEYQ